MPMLFHWGEGGGKCNNKVFSGQAALKCKLCLEIFKPKLIITGYKA